jgi:protein-L-isoaspartate(D-aspartate) O-methyltransferase
MSIDIDYERLRREMVRRQIASRGIRDEALLEAMARVRREGYIPSWLGEFAYEDAPLPIEEEQTISQPYIVATMIDALRIGRSSRVLEVGTGSGYAAAVLAELAAEVYTIERHASLAQAAHDRLRRDGYHNVHVQHGDGSLGWPENAPYDAIVVAAGGPRVPEMLKDQLAVGGRLVMPVGKEPGLQQLVRVVRTHQDRWTTEDLGAVRFVPLVGAQGWREAPAPEVPARPAPLDEQARTEIMRRCEPFVDHADADLRPLLRRIGDARVVLVGESTHGSSEFHRLRARLTRELVESHGFTIVALEADWPDAARIDKHARDLRVPDEAWEAFARFPTWMWRNEETREFVEWLRARNMPLPPERRARMAGLDLYAMSNSIAELLGFLDRRDPAAAALARERYSCLTPWQRDPAAYGRAAVTGAYRSCEGEATAMLRELMRRRLDQARRVDERWFDAEQNAHLVADAELYYRVMYYGGADAWNLRDRHMFRTLLRLLDFHGPTAKVVVWAHNSHIGDASATDMAARGETNLGELCRAHFGPACYSIGLGTHHGTVAAASHWDGPVEFKRVRPALEGSWERLCHDTKTPGFLLPLRGREDDALRLALERPRLQRAIGVVYRPETERHSHYYHADLPRQFDEWIWIDETSAVTPLPARERDGVLETWPSGL